MINLMEMRKLKRMDKRSKGIRERTVPSKRKPNPVPNYYIGQ
jgi:hypothetical protein